MAALSPKREDKNMMKAIKDINWKFTGLTEEVFQFVENFHLTDEIHWRRFVEQFRIHSDVEDRGWKGEFWGKMMRGASLVYAYTKNETLYRTLSKTVEDMIESQDALGRISTYTVEEEFTGWDLWCRKYVMLGMEYFLDICKEEALEKKIIASLQGQADYLLEKIGPGEGQRSIAESAIFWRGLSASSILEPIVRLYHLTREERYLAFAEYIVESGGSSVANIFKLAYEDQFSPYQYPVTKAYEMISCFEGLLALYRETGTAWYKDAIIRFANQLLETEFTIIGCSGCSHELFDHSTVRQARPSDGESMQETCVTVTLMKFFYQVYLLTGDSTYVDAFERSYYNAYLGALNTEKRIGIDVTKLYNGAYKDAIAEALPFDSYSPLTANTRGNGIGGVRMMPDFHYYGCCACIGSAGIGLVPQLALTASETGFAMNLYLPGTITTAMPSGQAVTFETETTYPAEGAIRITIHMDKPEELALAFRIPAWSKMNRLQVNGEEMSCQAGYTEVTKVWKEGDQILLDLDMRTEVLYPISYGSQILMTEMLWNYDYVVPVYDVEDETAKDHVAFRRGPLILAGENRLGYRVEDAHSFAIGMDGYIEGTMAVDEIAPYPHIVEMEIPLHDGSFLHLTDYASAGKTWNEESKMAAWLRRQ